MLIERELALMRWAIDTSVLLDLVLALQARVEVVAMPLACPEINLEGSLTGLD